MLALAIETSCDETSLAIIKWDENFDTKNFLTNINQVEILSSIISSQIKIHEKYGGVVPEIGARQHAEQIHWLFEQILNNAKELSKQEILNQLDYIFVTTEPGLASALRVGIEFAKSIKFFLQEKYKKDLKIQAINHLNGHLASSFYKQKLVSTKEITHSEIDPLIETQNIEVFPHLHLLVSGGNSQLILLNSWQDRQIVGRTLDDAAGECFDKIGRMLGLNYPAGVLVAKIAGLQESNPLNLPIGMKNSDSLDYSFSGLKTAVRYLIQKQNIPDFGFEKNLKKDEIEALLSSTNQLNEKLKFIQNLCISAQFVIVSQLINKLKMAIKKHSPNSLGLSGGVSANLLLRQKVMQTAQKNSISQDSVFIAQTALTGDNAIMIALAGVLEIG